MIQTLRVFRHPAPLSRQFQIHLLKLLIGDQYRRALAFGGLSFAGLDSIAHDLLLLRKRAAVGIVPSGANLSEIAIRVIKSPGSTGFDELL
jgi:hypothetical protein